MIFYLDFIFKYLWYWHYLFFLRDQSIPVMVVVVELKTYSSLQTASDSVLPEVSCNLTRIAENDVNFCHCYLLIFLHLAIVIARDFVTISTSNQLAGKVDNFLCQAYSCNYKNKKPGVAMRFRSLYRKNSNLNDRCGLSIWLPRNTNLYASVKRLYTDWV